MVLWVLQLQVHWHACVARHTCGTGHDMLVKAVSMYTGVPCTAARFSMWHATAAHCVFVLKRTVMCKAPLWVSQVWMLLEGHCTVCC